MIISAKKLKLNDLRADFDSLVNRKGFNTIEESFDSTMGMESKSKSQSAVHVEYSLQRHLREMFGRDGINSNSIASHPDFYALAQSNDTINQYICPIFIDIVGSTRLSLKYDLEFVYKFKNAVIQACIEVIRTFDGYVHRIMGDAVLGFFGGSNISKEQAALDCINATVMLNVVLDKVIRPWLKSEKEDFEEVHDFGFRIGCNFGDDNEVLWGNYGYGNVGEVSPTGFPIDLAAKLQGLSSKNKAMLGQGLLEILNFPEDFTSIKNSTKSGEKVQIPYIVPNYVINGKEINYIMRVLNFDNYIAGLPIGTYLKESISTKIKYNPSINLDVIVEKTNGEKINFCQGGNIIDRGSSINFSIRILSETHLGFPLRVRFRKINQLGFKNEENLLDEENHIEKFEQIVNKTNKTGLVKNFEVRNFSRQCEFKGVHQFQCEVLNKENYLIFRDVVNVPIK